MNREIRFFNTEIRVGATDSQGDEMTLMGYAAKFNVQSQDLGGFREMVMPGAFESSLKKKADVKFLKNHDPNIIMGRTKNGTLSLEEDNTGLKFRVVLPNTQDARDLYTLVKRGDIDQCSFAFMAKDDEWSDERDGNGDLYASRKLKDLDLLDVSAVTYPAYLDTQVNARCFPDGEPMEVRTALNSLKEKRGSENQPPENGGGTVATQIQWPLAANIKDDWFKAFEEAYDDLMKKGGRDIAVKEALAMAVAKANAKVQPQTEVRPEVSGQSKDPTDVPHEVVPTWERHSLLGELRHSEGTYEDMIADLNCALKDKYGMTSSNSMWSGCPKYWVVETYPDKIIAVNNDDGGYYSLAYKYDPSAEEGEEVTFSGDPMPVEQQYVPSGRMLFAAEARVYKSSSEVPAYVPKDKRKQWMEVWNSAYAKAKKDGKEQSEAESSAFAQANSVTGVSPKGWTKDDDGNWTKKRGRPEDVSDPESPDYDPEDESYDPELDESNSAYKADRYLAAVVGEDRDRKTKKVAGQNLTSDKFAWVGDPNDPSTWKLPVHDEGHARNALARYNQTKGIPSDKKESVWKKIVAACKKFGIEVADEDSIRAGIPHEITLAILNDDAGAEVLAALKNRMRVIEIDLA